MLDLNNLLRPNSLADFVGQEHLISADSILGESIKKGALPHCIFFGPPGCGKTTLARLIAKSLDTQIGFFNASAFKLEELKNFIKTGKHEEGTSLLNTDSNTFKYDKCAHKIIFIDEIHRLNKTQQEFLLPLMENIQETGTNSGNTISSNKTHKFTIFGASTYNPFYSLTHALRSRSFLFELKPLSEENLKTICKRAYSITNKSISKDIQDYIIHTSAGDARALLNILSLILEIENLTLEKVKSLRPYALRKGTSEADSHYDLISALIKSIRGSDVNASLYYLARLVAEGEAPDFIARRLVILSSEDIGNANPNALNIATSTLLAVEKIGYPEARIILSQCVIYLASAPKSNTAYIAINSALNHIKNGEILHIPEHIHTHSKQYLYPHDFGGFVRQKYLEKPLNLVPKSNIGFEKTLNEWLDKIHSLKPKK